MKFYNSDILDAPLIDDSVHLIITSPPYNVGINYDMHDDTKPYEEYLDWLTGVFVYLQGKLVNGGRICINIAPTGVKNFTPIHHDLITNLRKIGFTLVGEILWYKQNIKSRTAWGSFKSPRRPYVLPSWEYIYVLQKGTFLDGDVKPVIVRRRSGTPKKFKLYDRIKSDEYGKPDITSEEFVKFTDGFWYIQPEKVKRGHPVPFPEELIYRLIKLYSYPGDTVLDPFGGSGTVAAVCAKTNRKSIYVDISPEYLEMAKARVAEIPEKKIKCPSCSSEDIKKHGLRGDRVSKAFEGYTGFQSRLFKKQRYRCKECGRRFTL